MQHTGVSLGPDTVSAACDGDLTVSALGPNGLEPGLVHGELIVEAGVQQ